MMNKKVDKLREGRMSLFRKVLKGIANFQVENPYTTITVILAATAVIAGGLPYLKTVASLEKMMPTEMEEIKYFNVLRDNALGKDMIGLVIEVDRGTQHEFAVTDIRDPRVLTYIIQLKNIVKNKADIVETFAVTDALIKYNNNELPDKQTLQKLMQNPETARILNRYLNDDYSTTYIIANTDTGLDDERLNRLAESIQEDVADSGKPAGVKVKLTGVPIIQQKLSELIKKDRSNTQWISALLVFAITLIIYRSFFSGLIPVLIVLTSVTWLYGTMGYLGLGISTLAGGVAAIVIGIGIDYSIHLMNRYKFERRQGKEISDAIEEAVVSTGTALTASSLTTLSAFFAFLFGAMPEMGRFGLLMMIGIFYAFLFSMVGLPALLVIEEKKVSLFKSGLLTKGGI